MYSRSEGIVKWNPTNIDAAEQAMRDVVDDSFVWDDERNRRELDDETAREVQKRYAELVDEQEDEK